MREMLAVGIFFSRVALSADARDALAWLDTLGFPDAKDLSYVRVATGSWTQRGNQTPENRFVEGFLVREEPDAFTVFICSVSDFKDRFGSDEPHAPLTTVRFTRMTTGPAHKRVDFEVLDFKKVSSEVLDRVRVQSVQPLRGLQWGQPLAHRARIVAFARACLQKDLSETASALLEIAANIPDEQTGKVEPQMLRDALQRQIGDAAIIKAEAEFSDLSLSWADLLKAYENFHTRYPASPRVAYGREAADLLRKMIAEAVERRPKPLEQMSPAEQVAENIYQLRNLGGVMWIMYNRYPAMASTRDGKEVITPIHRLVDLGDAAVPQLIEALDDKRFTRSMVQRFKGWQEPKVMRVGEVAQKILEHLSGQNFYPHKTDAGKLVNGTTRQQAEAWWAEVQSKGEKEVLIRATVAGNQTGCIAARKLVAKYPDAALDAIEAGIRASTHEGYRGEFVEVAGGLPGDTPLTFLKSKLDPGNGLYSQVRAAEALFARGQPGAVPAMIEAWRKVQSHLPANEGDAYSEVGGLITFLAKSGDAKAIEALRHDLHQKAPVDVRLAVVKVFLPWPKTHGDSGSIGRSVSARADIPKLPAGEAGLAIERLLVSALDDTERRFGMKGNYNEASYEDPRICDMAAVVLSCRWPEKYRFQWVASSAECDAQIARLRDHWRSEHGLPPLRPFTPAVIPAARESDVAPLLDDFAAASDVARRDAITARIGETFGLGALPVVRSRYESSKNAAFRSLAINLACRVREVVIQAGAGESAAQSGIESLRGQPLDAEHLYKLATDMEAGLPPNVRAVTFVAERTGDGTGFKITIGWLAGGLDQQTGWDRETAIRGGNKSLHGQMGYSATKGGMRKEAVYREMADAFEKALQSEIDAPIIARFRIQRSDGR